MKHIQDHNKKLKPRSLSGNTFGWDEGDENDDRVRNSYDVGDTNKNGKQDSGETWTGRKT